GPHRRAGGADAQQRLRTPERLLVIVRVAQLTELRQSLLRGGNLLAEQRLDWQAEPIGDVAEAASGWLDPADLDRAHRLPGEHRLADLRLCQTGFLPSAPDRVRVCLHSGVAAPRMRTSLLDRPSVAHRRQSRGPHSHRLQTMEVVRSSRGCRSRTVLKAPRS